MLQAQYHFPFDMGHPYSPRGAGYRDSNGVNDLIAMIDEHLARQVASDETARPSSAGTMFVDWDGSGEPQITYRNRSTEEQTQKLSMSSRQRNDSMFSNLSNEPQQRKPRTVTARNVQKQHTSRDHQYPREPQYSTSATDSNSRSSSTGPAPSNSEKRRTKETYRTSDGLTATYHASRNSHTRPAYIYPAYVAGHDPNTNLKYDYNGRIIHVRRPRQSTESQISEYYAVDAADYEPAAAFRVVDKELPVVPEQRKTRVRVVKFIQKLLYKFEGLGIMKKLKEERKMEIARATWVRNGYVT